MYIDRGYRKEHENEKKEIEEMRAEHYMLYRHSDEDRYNFTQAMEDRLYELEDMLNEIDD